MTQSIVFLRLLAALSIAIVLAGGAIFATMAAPAQPDSPATMRGQDDDGDDDQDDDGSGNATGNATGVTATAGAGNGTSGNATVGVGRPAHIHAGTCAELDPNPAFPLNSVVARGDNGVEVSESEVPVALAEIMAQPHAINVHASQEDAETYVACGEVTGEVIDDDLIIGLHPQNDSGLAGIAILEDDDDDGETEVKVYLTAIEDDEG